MAIKTCVPIPKELLNDPKFQAELGMCKPNGKWPIDTYLQRRLKEIRSNPLYQGLYPPVIREGGE